MRRIGGLPAALVAAVDRRACRALRAAFRTEFAGVDRAAGTRPACRGLGFGLFRAAFWAELAGGCRAAGALPGVRARLNRRALLRSLRLLLRAHLEQLRRIDSAALLGHIHAHEAGERAALVFRGVLHGLRLRAHQMRRRHVRVAENGVLLQLLDHRLVLFGGFDGVYAKGDDLHAAQIRPLFGEHVVERGGDLRGVPRQRAVADALLGNLCERGLKRGQQFAFDTISRLKYR